MRTAFSIGIDLQLYWTVFTKVEKMHAYVHARIMHAPATDVCVYATDEMRTRLQFFQILCPY